ncbi:MAG: sensor histidine kinase [Egibacteraceae bacterium]
MTAATTVRERMSRVAPTLAIVVTVVAAVVVGSALVARGAIGQRPLDWLGYALLAAGGTALLALRRSPFGVLAFTVAAGFVYDTLDYPGGFYLVSVYAAVFAAVALGRRLRIVVAAAVAIFALFLIVDVPFPRGHVIDAAGAAFFIGWMALSVVAGELWRVQRARLAETERRAVEAERLRIARELHDVLAHSIATIKVQAGVAAHLLDRQPEQARSALLAIDEASKNALRELRGTLGLLRQVDEDAPRAPTPSLANLDDLVAGVPLQVEVSVTGEARPLPAPVDLAAYRIVQESLTNVARHAGPAAATLSVTYGPRDLVIQVDDDGRGVPVGASPAGGPGGPGENGGTGLVGMRERARAAGGELHAGPRAEGGFRVRARLPLDGPP